MNAPVSRPVSILIVDDSELVRVGLRTLLGAYPALKIAGEAGSVAAAVVEAERLRPDLVLLDIRLPDGSGFEACRHIVARLPETRIIVLTAIIEDHMVYDAISSGAHGYLLKEINGQGLVQAILDVASGKSILDPAVTGRVLRLVKSGPGGLAGDKLALLSVQERRVLALVADGRTNKEVGQQMGLSEKTVKNYLSNVFDKLQINRRSQAAAFYAQNRLTETRAV
jgi:two-component system, NarL family, response regulator DevR